MVCLDGTKVGGQVAEDMCYRNMLMVNLTFFMLL